MTASRTQELPATILANRDRRLGRHHALGPVLRAAAPATTMTTSTPVPSNATSVTARPACPPQCEPDIDAPARVRPASRRSAVQVRYADASHGSARDGRRGWSGTPRWGGISISETTTRPAQQRPARGRRSALASDGERLCQALRLQRPAPMVARALRVRLSWRAVARDSLRRVNQAGGAVPSAPRERENDFPSTVRRRIADAVVLRARSGGRKIDERGGNRWVTTSELHG
jgi:hypothetical protein